MNFAALKTELKARGFDYLSDTRAGQYINWANQELDDTELWPYRLVTVSGSGGNLSTVPQGGVIRSVKAQLGDTFSWLREIDRNELMEAVDAQAATGPPVYWFDEGPNTGNRVISSYPATTSVTLYVDYFAPASTMSGGTDSPASPARFHRLIVDLAVERAYRDSDNFQAANALRGAIERDLQVMRNALLTSASELADTAVYWALDA